MKTKEGKKHLRLTQDILGPWRQALYLIPFLKSQIILWTWSHSVGTCEMMNKWIKGALSLTSNSRIETKVAPRFWDGMTKRWEAFEVEWYSREN